MNHKSESSTACDTTISEVSKQYNRSPSPSSSLNTNTNTTMIVDNNNNDTTNSSIAILLDDETNYQCRDYLKDDCNDDDDTSSSSNIVTGACRVKVVRWLLDIVKCLKMSPDTAVDAISNLDRAMCVSSKARSNRKAYQLASMAALCISIKINESIEVDTPTILSKVSRGLVSAKDIRSCEKEMISALEYKIHGPKPSHFIRLILDLIPNGSVQPSVINKIYSSSCAESVILLQDYKFVRLKTSCLAIASIINTLKTISEDDFSASVRVQLIKSVKNAFDLKVPKTNKRNKRRGGCFDSPPVSSPCQTSRAIKVVSPGGKKPPQVPHCGEEEEDHVEVTCV